MDALMIASGGVPPPGVTSPPAASGNPATAGVPGCAGQSAPFAMLMAALVPPAVQGEATPASGEPSTVPGAWLAGEGAGVMLPPDLFGGAVTGPTAAVRLDSIDLSTPRPDRAAEAGASGLESILAALLLTAPAVNQSPEVAAGIPAAGFVAHRSEAVPAALTGGDSSPAAAPSPEGGREGVEARSLGVPVPGPAMREGGPAPGRSMPLAADGLPIGTLPIGAIAGAAAPGLTATAAADGLAAPPADRVPIGNTTSIASAAGAEANDAGIEAPASRQTPAIEAGRAELAAGLLDGAGAPTSVPLPAAAGLASTGGPGAAASGVASERGVVDSTSGPGLADGLAESVQGALRRGERDMRLVLNPPELGEVHVRVQESAAGIRVALEAATREAHDLIQRHLPALREGLVSRDLPVDRLDVQRLERGTGSPAFDGGAGRGAAGDGQPGNRWAGATGEGFGGTGEPGWSPVTRLGLGGRVTDERLATGAGSPVSRDAGVGRLDVRA